MLFLHSSTELLATIGRISCELGFGGVVVIVIPSCHGLSRAGVMNTKSVKWKVWGSSKQISFPSW